MRKAIYIFSILLMITLLASSNDLVFAQNGKNLNLNLAEFYLYKTFEIIGLIAVSGIFIIITVVGREIKNTLLFDFGKIFLSISVIKFIYVLMIEKETVTDIISIQNIVFLNLSIKFIIIYSLIFFIIYQERLKNKTWFTKSLYYVNIPICLFVFFAYTIIVRQKDIVFIDINKKPTLMYIFLEILLLSGIISSFILLFYKKRGRSFKSLTIFTVIFGSGNFILPLFQRNGVLLTEGLQNLSLVYLFLAIFLSITLKHFQLLKKLFMFSEEVLKEKLDIQKSFELLVSFVHEMYSDIFERICFYYLSENDSYELITAVDEDMKKDSDNNMNKGLLKFKNNSFKAKTNIIVVDIYEIDQFFEFDKNKLNYISKYKKAVIVPIYLQKDIVGFLICYTPFSDFDLSSELKEGLLIFKNFSQALLLQIERIEKVKALSAEDELTGLFNRRFFMKEMIAESLTSDRYGTKFCLAFFDMDNLKTLNDVYGHAVGDKAIKIIANVLKNNIRKFDIPARLGGDEFAVIFKNCSIEAIEDRIFQIKKLIEEESEKNLPEKIYVSCGIAVYPDDSSSLDELLKIADSRMYEEKYKHRGGREDANKSE